MLTALAVITAVLAQAMSEEYMASWAVWMIFWSIFALIRGQLRPGAKRGGSDVDR